MAQPLASTDLPIGEIAGVIGWKNQFHASQCFHTA
jgi:transcriptional regulator GlxA family with amidase domain